MSFIEGMILCFIFGWLNSYFYSYHFSKKHKGFLFWFETFFLVTLIIFDILIYLNILNARWFTIIPWIKIPETVDLTNIGKYWLFTPGLIIGIPLELPVINYDGFVWNIYAIIFILSYVCWWTLGQNLGRIMYGRQEFERGIWYLLRPTKKKNKNSLISSNKNYKDKKNQEMS